MKELMRGSFAPITNTIGFLQCARERAVEKYLQWQEPIQQKRGVKLVRTEIGGSLPEVVQSLLPLTSVERRRFLFIPTSDDWTAFIDNGHHGTDAFAPLSFLAEVIKCRALRATATPHRPDRRSFGATILEIYGPNQAHFLNYVRSIAAAYDGQKWTFAAAGEVQPFERTEQYHAPSIKDRFTAEILDVYLQAMGIRAFDEDFYLRNNLATLIQKVGPIAPGAKEFQLAEVQR